MEAAYERKKEKKSELFAPCTDAAWKASIYQVEVGYRGFIGTYTQ